MYVTNVFINFTFEEEFRKLNIERFHLICDIVIYHSIAELYYSYQLNQFKLKNINGNDRGLNSLYFFLNCKLGKPYIKAIILIISSLTNLKDEII